MAKAKATEAPFIVAGVVSIEDGIKAKEEFAPARKARVELTFSVPEGAEGQKYLNAVVDIANDKLAEILGRPVMAKPVVTAPVEAPKTTAKAPSDKDKLAAEQGLPTTSQQHKGETPALVDDLEAPPAKTTVPKDDLDDLLGDTAKTPVTDAELGKAAQAKNGAMKDKPGWAPEKIRKLIADYAGEGKRINEIPAAKRHEFLERLEALK